MKIVLIGHGMVGHKFLESLAETGITGVEVTVLCEEPRPAYDRVHLSEFFSGKSAAELSLVEPGFFERTGFSLRLATRAASIDRRTNTATTAASSAWWRSLASRTLDKPQRARRKLVSWPLKTTQRW